MRPLQLFGGGAERPRPAEAEGPFDPADKEEAATRRRDGLPGRPDDHLVSLLAPGSMEAEQYRMLRYRIERRHQETGLRVIAVTSPSGGEGKTTTAINVAGSLAQSPETRVLLVDADLRRPSVARQLGWPTPVMPGLSEAIRYGALSLKDVVRPRQRFNLHMVAAGALAVPPYELLKSPRLRDLFEEARRTYDYVIVDTPPVLPCPDYALVERCADGVLVVVAAHRTRRALLEQALQSVEESKVLGLVFNQDDGVGTHYQYSGYSIAEAHVTTAAGVVRRG